MSEGIARQCAHCGASLIGKRPNAKVCSPRCSRALGYLRRRGTANHAKHVSMYRAKRKAATPVVTCAACGAGWQRRLRVDIRRRFCFECVPPGDKAASRNMSVRFPDPETAAMLAEKRAGEARAAARNRRRSAARRRLAKAALGSAGRCHLVMGWCRECGNAFVVRQVEGVWCSAKCRRRGIGREARYRRRARVAGGRVNRQAVFKRDGWICQLCGQPVDRTASVPDPLAATIDHVVPLAKGGEHNDANAQCAHFMCNCLKSDSLAA